MPALGVGEALVAVWSVAVGDVSGEGQCEGVPVGVVGVLDDELADRQEVAFDAVQEADVGRGGHEFDVVRRARPRMSASCWWRGCLDQ